VKRVGVKLDTLADAVADGVADVAHLSIAPRRPLVF
jgi:hypothetical protein